jgi:hypothetical protein
LEEFGAESVENSADIPFIIAMARGDYGVEAEASEVDFTDSLFAVEDDSEVDLADSVLAVLERSLTLSRATPFSVIPSSSAARLERSRLRPRTCVRGIGYQHL